MPPRSLGKLPGEHHVAAWARADTWNRAALSFCCSCDLQRYFVRIMCNVWENIGSIHRIILQA